MKIGFIGFLIVCMITAAIGAWLFPYTINSWLVFLGKTPKVVWWHGALLGFAPFIGQLCIPLAVCTWILMLFLT
jgi:hypothetical protein